jgi:hypothetical protein
MQFIPIWSYDNYVPAHIAMGRLQEEEIDCWLKDENTVTLDPLLTNALGGIKLMVDKDKAEAALVLLNGNREKYKSRLRCKKCGSHNMELVTSPKQTGTWLSFIVGLFLTSFALTGDKVYHCFDCGHESKSAKEELPDVEE